MGSMVTEPVSQEFPLTERFNLADRGEVFDLFHTPQFDLPDASIGNPGAGPITGIVANPGRCSSACGCRSDSGVTR